MLQNTDWGLECKWDMRGNRREIFQQLKSDCPETWIFALQSEIHRRIKNDIETRKLKHVLSKAEDGSGKHNILDSLLWSKNYEEITLGVPTYLHLGLT